MDWLEHRLYDLSTPPSSQRRLLKSNSHQDPKTSRQARFHFEREMLSTRSTRSMYASGGKYVIVAVRRAVGVTNRAHNPLAQWVGDPKRIVRLSASFKERRFLPREEEFRLVR